MSRDVLNPVASVVWQPISATKENCGEVVSCMMSDDYKFVGVRVEGDGDSCQLGIGVVSKPDLCYALVNV